MKRVFLSIIVILSCFVVQAEENYTLFNTLNGGQDHHYTACSYIALITGFQSEPDEGHEVTLDIDSYGVFPPTSGITGGPDNNNSNGVVGSLGGVVDVSLLGGAVYSIPIDLPKGLGGLMPSLSITYNSQGHNGLLGWAWNLEGISSITRSGCTNYHDGHASGVNYWDDRFCLDGQRLMMIGNDDYGGHGTTYRTEQDQLSKIVSYQESDVTGPSYFKVWTADGRILHYGSSDDSKALMSSYNQVGIWLLKKVEDRNGNYMEYHYTNDANTYRLSSITYSGNSHDNIAPAFSVAFQYDDRSDIEVSFVGNQLFRQNKILKGITINHGNETMFSYQFTYKSPNPKNGYPYHLLTEIRLSSGNQHLNPTKIQWGSNNYNIGSGADVKVSVTTNGVNNGFVNAVKFSGDFNGDGYADVIAAKPNSIGTYNIANVFINKGMSGNAIFELQTSLFLNSNISWIHVSDFNGDGLDDILLSYRDRNHLIFPDELYGKIELSQLDSDGTLSFRTYLTPTVQIPHNLIDAHLVGDFLGEGKSTILIQSVNDDKTFNTKLLTYDETSDSFKVRTFAESLSANRFYPADYDGDGITEILYKKANGSSAIAQVKLTNGIYYYTEPYNGAPWNWNDCFPGDYNGDGLIDALFYKANSSTPWEIRLSSQVGFSQTTYSLPETFPYSSPGNYLFSLDQPNHTSQYIKVGDFDGNGCADLGLFEDNIFYVFYGPLRTTGDYAPFAGNQRISVQLFNLYDNMTMCLGNFLGQEGVAYLGSNTISHLPMLTKRHEVNKITDGFGRLTEFTYDYLMPKPNSASENDFYRLVSSPSNLSSGIHCVAIPLRGVSKVKRYNIKGKTLETRCYYEGGLLSNQGKGFLGFSKTRQEDYCNNQLRQKTIRQYEVIRGEQAFDMMVSQKHVYDGNSQLVAKSIYSNALYEHLGNEKVFIPISNTVKDEYDVDNSRSLSKREIYESIVNTNCSQNHKYNNVISVTSQINGTTDNPGIYSASLCEYQQIINTEYVPANLSTWLINKPATITETLHRNGDDEDICHQKIYSYLSNTPHQISSILNIPNNGSHPEDRLASIITYQYDPVGNVSSQTISTPNDNLSSRIESFEYSPTYGRLLLTKHTDALNQSTSYQYDPVYHYCSSVIDCNGLETTYEEDPFGIDSKTTLPDGTVSCKAMRWGSSYYYQLEKKTGQATKISCYDMTGDIVQTRNYDLDGELLLSDYCYDDLGRVKEKKLTHRIGETPQSIQYGYDGHNRTNRITHADGSYETIQYNGNQRIISFKAPNLPTRTESKTYNVIGKLTKSTDADGNSVIYDYYADSKPKWFQIEGQNETRIEMAYDGLGNRILLNDPDYGVTTCEYNAFNELIRNTSAKLDQTSYSYDALGRLVMRIETDASTNTTETTEWFYGQEKGLSGLLTRITSPNQNINYEYDELLRLIRATENTLGKSYQTSYAYDNASRIARIAHPSDFEVNYCYSSDGYLRSILDSQSKVLWKVSETNALLQPTKCVTGNGFVSYYDYDSQTQRLTSILTMHDDLTIQDYGYQYDKYSNIISRSDNRNRFTESFAYDELNRLTDITDDEGTSHFGYDAMGRMIEKTRQNESVFNNADYSGPRPHAIKSVQAAPGVFPQERMDLAFNSFDKVSSISEGSNSITFEYGYDHNRIRAMESVNGTNRCKDYVGHCEFITGPNGKTSTRTLLTNPSGVFAIAETVDGETKLHYIHKDHLGSWTTISDDCGNIEQEVSFDAWGNTKEPDDLLFDRGFTGHEHIKGMGLINMNGRLYDPIISSMLSPDNNIQSPDFTQNLNRYSYCFNNPLTYVDPDGNSAMGCALFFYLMFFTDYGYELQKYTSPLAFHIDLHLSSQQLGIGTDCSVGVPKSFPAAARFHGGVSYYLQYYDNSYQGIEYRAGMEWSFLGVLGISGTSFHQGERKQTTNAIILGTPSWSVTYENDYMFHLGDHLLMGFEADGGDRYRSAAARIRIGLFETGVNLFTGDPGVDHKYRRTFFDPSVNSPYYDESAGGRETYTTGANGENPNQYRAGVFYVGFGPIKLGANNEQIRNTFQNQFAHDFLCKGDSPYFQILDRPGQFYFHFGSSTGNSLW